MLKTLAGTEIIVEFFDEPESKEVATMQAATSFQKDASDSLSQQARSSSLTYLNDGEVELARTRFSTRWAWSRVWGVKWRQFGPAFHELAIQ